MSFRRISISVKVFEKMNSILAWVLDRPILLAKFENRYYAMDAVCGHMGCALLDKVEGNIAICPAHGAQYDITNGKKVMDARIKPEISCEYKESGEGLRTYNVMEKDGFIEVDL